MAVQISGKGFPVPNGRTGQLAGPSPVFLNEPTEWQVCAASAPGSRQERRQQPNQDAAGYRITTDGLLIAVSDGAGSAKYSAEGSRLAVTTALESLARNAEHPLTQGLEQAMADARQAIITLAEKAGRRPGEYAATLSLAMACDGHFAATQTGDGGVAYAGADGVYHMATMPCRGEYANSTEFITASQWRQPPVTEVNEGVDRVLATTDGMLNLAMKLLPDGSYRPHPPFHDVVFEWLESREDAQGLDSYLELRGLLRNAKTRTRTDDDATIVIARRNDRGRP